MKWKSGPYGCFKCSKYEKYKKHPILFFLSLCESSFCRKLSRNSAFGKVSIALYRNIIVHPNKLVMYYLSKKNMYLNGLQKHLRFNLSVFLKHVQLLLFGVNKDFYVLCVQCKLIMEFNILYSLMWLCMIQTCDAFDIVFFVIWP